MNLRKDHYHTLSAELSQIEFSSLRTCLFERGKNKSRGATSDLLRPTDFKLTFVMSSDIHSFKTLITFNHVVFDIEYTKVKWSGRASLSESRDAKT